MCFSKTSGRKFLHNLVSHLQNGFLNSYVLTALVVFDAVNMLAKSFIFHGKEEIEFLVTYFGVDSADVGSE